MSSFANDFLPSGQVTLSPESPLGINVPLDSEEQHNNHDLGNKLRGRINEGDECDSSKIYRFQVVGRYGWAVEHCFEFFDTGAD